MFTKKISILIKKKNIVIWRGCTTGRKIESKNNRLELVKKWYLKNKNIDVGINEIVQNKRVNTKYIKNTIHINNMLKYKYLLSIEGNDVATGLKWMLASNSVVLMPKPTVVSWFMEDHLVPYKHYVPIKSDFSDLLEVYNWCESNNDKCKKIIQNANMYVYRFLNEFKNGFHDKIMEKMIQIYKKNVKFNF